MELHILFAAKYIKLQVLTLCFSKSEVDRLLGMRWWWFTRRNVRTSEYSFTILQSTFDKKKLFYNLSNYLLLPSSGRAHKISTSGIMRHNGLNSCSQTAWVKFHITLVGWVTCSQELIPQMKLLLSRKEWFWGNGPKSGKCPESFRGWGEAGLSTTPQLWVRKLRVGRVALRPLPWGWRTQMHFSTGPSCSRPGARC